MSRTHNDTRMETPTEPKHADSFTETAIKMIYNFISDIVQGRP